MPPAEDNDLIRQNLALYKFTDMNFFEGITQFLISYFHEFLEVYERYIVMRWEDLISNPIATIKYLAIESGINISDEYAASIWQKIDHVNLTQAHKHNYRQGHGVVGGWKNWITNHHLQMIKDFGFEPYMQELGFGKIEFFKSSEYTPFQQKVDEYINSGRVYNDFPDKELFTFAFNKSNFTSDKFSFKRYPWRDHTQIERSIFSDEALLNKISDRAETSTSELNSFFVDYLDASQDIKPTKLLKLLNSLEKRYQSILGNKIGIKYTQAFREAKDLINIEDEKFFAKFKNTFEKWI